MNNILKYSFYEMVRSRWAYIYTGFYLVATISLYLLSNDMSKTIISLSNISLALTPLIGILFGTTYFYNSKDFMQLLMSQPISRWELFLAMYGGLAINLCLSVLIGMGLPLIMLGVTSGPSAGVFWVLIAMACTLSVIFSLLAFLIAMRFDDKIRGLSLSIFLWLFFAILYDGIILLLMFLFKDYPLDKFTIGVMVTNPIDLARILIMMKLDVSAMMGYTGAVLTKFLGHSLGVLMIVVSLLVWIIVPLYALKRLGNKKDF